MNLYWFFGNQYDVNKSVNEVLSKFSGWRVFRLNGEQHKSSDVYQRLAEKNVLGDTGRVIIFKYLPEDYAKLIDINITDNRALLIVSPLSFKMFGYSVKADTSKFIQIVKEKGEIFNFPIECSPAKAKAWTNNLLKDLKLKVNDDAIEPLIYKCNCNLDLIYSELIKLSQYVFPKKSITLDDIESCVIDMKESVIWNWADSLLTKESGQVLYELEQLLNDDTQVEQLLSMLIQKLETTLFIRDSCSDLSYKCVADALSPFQKPSKTGVMQKYTSQHIGQMANSYAVKEAVKKNGIVKLSNCLSIVYSLRTMAREVYSESYKRMIITLCSLLVSDFQYAGIINSFVETKDG